METLKTVLTYKWYDMIESDVKKEEYRSINEYWVNRLFNWKSSGYTLIQFVENLKQHPNEAWIWEFIKPISYFQPSRGYTSRVLLREVNSIDIGPAVPEWSDNWQGNVFRIHLGKKI